MAQLIDEIHDPERVLDVEMDAYIFTPRINELGLAPICCRRVRWDRRRRDGLNAPMRCLFLMPIDPRRTIIMQ